MAADAVAGGLPEGVVFAVETQTRGLFSFVDEANAVAHCEGLDVEAAQWLFWDSRGRPLAPEFVVPNRRGLFGVTNGFYKLVPAVADHHACLQEALDEILAYDGLEGLRSAQAVRCYMER